MILIKKQYHLQLQDTFPKILQISPVPNGFLFIAISQDHHQQRLVHVDNHGKTIWQTSYKDSIDHFALIQENLAVVLNVNDNKILIINLHDHTINSVDHQYKIENTSNTKIIVFPQTNIFAILETNREKQQYRFIVTYYRRENQSIRKIIIIDHSDNITTTDIKFNKVNDHSKIAIWSSNAQKNIIVFQTIDFIQQASKALQITTNINIPNCLNLKYQLPNILACIINIKQISANKYLLVCDTNRVPQDLDQSINNNYILDAQERVIRQAGFVITSNQNYHFCDYYSFGSYSAFLHFRTNEGGMGDAPIFYVDHKNQKIVAKEEWKATNKSNFTVNEFDSSMIIQAIHDNAYVKQIKIITKRLAQYKQIYLHFMLHIEEEFDDDLLSDAIGLLTDQ